ncbi:MAG TPA: hypothetical protein VJT71_10965 [Pyrinomonadaceae bacterium]|nr:hypothetical protein [Pyrinomonadaceae bacterium]
MADKKESDAALEITPGDVSITNEGAVEIVNARLAEVVRNAIQMEAEFGRRVTRNLDDSNTGCGNNVYQCGQPTATTKPVRVKLG